MLKLCGFAGSNYYNKVKLALLEKNLPFEEQLVWLDETDHAHSPLGKVPYLITEHGPLSESVVVSEYIEQRYPQCPLLPADPFAAAKVRELVAYIDSYLEMTVRELYGAAFFGGTVSDTFKARQHKLLSRYIPALEKLARFSPYIAGDSFTLADCSAIVHLPLVSMTTKIIYGEDMLAHLPVKDYLKRMGERPTVQRVAADRKAGTEAKKARDAAA